MATRSFRSVTLILVALLLANVALSSSAATQEGGPNLLVNGDFEAGDTGWTVPPDPGGRFEVIPDPDSPGSVARLTAEGFSMLQASQDFEIAPNTEYRLTARGCCTGEGYLSAGVALFWSPLGSRRYDSLDAESPGWQDLDTGWVYPGPDSTTLSAVLALENEGSPDVQPILLDDVVLQARPRAGPTPTPTPDREPNIYLNEVMHRAGERDWNGDGVVNFEDPWIEIYREPIGTQPVNLEGWFLDDGPGGSERFRLVGSTNIDNYAVLHTAYTRINLARNDLVLQLYRPDGSLADEAAFPLAAPDLSAGRFPDGTGGVTLEHAPTYLAANGSLGPAPRPEPRDMTIAEARALNSEDPIRIRGAVTAPPNLVGPKRMYVQDETAGILVLVTEDAPAIPQGSVVEVTGLAQTYFGEVALRPEDGGIVPSSEAVPQPEPARVQTGSIDAYTEGSLVTLRGRVASTSKPSVQVDDGSGEARVTLPESAAIPWPSPQSEDTLTAAGVVSSFNGSYQVLVRYAPDVTIERPPPPQPRDVTIREARTAPDDELLRVEGVVTAPPGALGEGRMYLQDASGGILVAGLPAAVALGSGDRVRLTGTAGASQGERLLRPRSPEDIARVGAGAPLPPTRVDLGAVGADTEGVLVEVEGTIATASWPSLYLDHAGEDVRVYASATARLQNPEARRGDRLRAAGVVSGRAGRYRVLPYLQAQLAVTRVEPPPEHRRASVAEARIAPDGAKLLVEAVVTAPPGALASRQMHIQDSTAGILVTLPEGAPSLAPGDVAQVRGEAGSHFGQRALRAEDGGVSLLRHGAPPAPRTLRSLEVGPATEGLLARVQGAVTGSGRPVIRVDDGIGEARVRLAEAAQIPWPSPERGDTLLATGIVGSHTGAYHLLPRTAGDLSLRRPPPPAPRRVSVREARAAADDALLEVEAVVTAPPGVLGRSRVYAQDSTGGIMVTGVGDASGLRGGDRVRLIGRAGAHHGERLMRLAAPSDIRRMSAGAELSPRPIPLSAIGPATEGALVRVAGPIASAAWPSLYVGLDSRAVRVYAHPDSGLRNPEARRGDTLEAAGIVGSYDGTPRLMPYRQVHLKLTRAAPEPPGPPDEPKPPSRPRAVTVAEARRLPEGAWVRLQGAVTSPPGLLRAGTMYLQDASGGVLVSLPEAAGALKLGDVVRVTGRTGAYFGERAVRARDGEVKYLRAGAGLRARRVSTGGLPRAGGWLVSLSGGVTGQGRPVIRVDDRSGEARIQLVDRAGIPWPSPSAGDTLTAVGVVRSVDGEAQLLPRYKGDLTLRRRPVPGPREVSIAAARSAPDNVLITLRGVVTAPPGPLGSSLMHVEDPSGGILVTGTPASPRLRSGDRVRLYGYPGAYFGERRLKLRSDEGARLLSRGTPLAPRQVAPAGVSRALEGRLVRVQGSVSDSAWPTISLSRPGEDLRVSVRDGAGVANPRARGGDTVRVTGVLGSRDGSPRLLPFAPAHVALIARAPGEEPPNRPRPPRDEEPDDPSGPGNEDSDDGDDPSPSDPDRPDGPDAPSPPGDAGPLDPDAPDDGNDGGAPPESRGPDDSDGGGNGDPDTPAYRAVSVAEARSAPEDARLRIEGRVTAPPGLLGERLMYVQDGSGGILVTGELPPAGLGETVRVEGDTGVYYSERRLEAATVARLGGSDLPSPRLVGPADVGAGTEGLLVTVQGEVAEGGWPSFAVGDPEVRVRVAPSTGIPDPDVEKGDGALVTGIVSRRSDRHRILPRYAADLVITPQPDATPTPTTTPRPTSASTPTPNPDDDDYDYNYGTPTPTPVDYDYDNGTPTPTPDDYDDDYGTPTPTPEGYGYDTPTPTGYDYLYGTPTPTSDDYYNDTPTPTPEAEASVTALSELRTLPLGSEVRFEAQVTAPPGALGEERMYVGDPLAGIALLLTGGGFPSLLEGDRVEARGELDTYHGERVVRLESGSDVSWLSNGTPVVPAEVSTAAIGPTTEGLLVTIKGQVKERQWPAFELDDGSGAAAVRVMDETGIQRPGEDAEDAAIVTGVVSQWDGRWRVLPRAQADLQFTTLPTLPDTGGAPPGGGALPGHYVWLPARRRRTRPRGGAAG